MRNLRRDQARAADWGAIENSRRRFAPPKPDRIDVMLKWGLFGWAMWMIWGGVALITVIALLIIF